MARTRTINFSAAAPARGLPTVYGELTANGQTIVLIPTEDAIRVCLGALKTATPAFKPSDPPGAITLPATWAGVVQLAYILGPAWQPGPRLRGWTKARLLERTVGRKGLRITPPNGCTPRAYQVTGALMIGETGRALLFDEQGTGKTITAILGLVERHAVVNVRPVVCVVPTSVVDSWIREWGIWAPSWRVVAWRGAPGKRRELAGTADVYVVGYDTARNDAAALDGPLIKLAPAAVVADECHYLKSPHAQRSVAVRRLAKRAHGAFVALSGTPITHHPGNLWPTLEALEPLAFPSKTRFIDRYCVKIQGDYAERIIGLNPHVEPELRASLLGQHRRVAKADVLDQLPPKIYSVRTVELPPAWRKVYDAMEAQMIAELPDGGELSVMSVLAQLTRLSQLASAASDVTTTVEDGPDGPVEHHRVTMRAPSWKVDALLEVLAERPGSPVVAFAPSRQLMMLAGAAALTAGYSVGYVVGEQSPKVRTEAVEHFQAGKFDVLCATTGAGGTGLTLTAARTVCFLQRPWSLVEALQAEDRCHRIGSEIHDSVEIIDIVAANTVDTRVRSVLREKAGQLAELLQDPRIVAELLGGARLTKRKRGAA